MFLEWPPIEPEREEPLSDPWTEEPGWACLSCWKLSNGMGSIKGGAFSPVESEPGKEVDVSSPLQNPGAEPVLHHALPLEETNPGEELLGLPLTIYWRRQRTSGLWNPSLRLWKEVAQGNQTLVQFCC